MPTFCKSDCSNPPCKHIQVRLYVSFRFAQHALPNTCSSSCRHAGFKCMFDLKISLMTQANSLKILQTTEIHRPTLAKPVSKVKSLVSGCPLRREAYCKGVTEDVQMGSTLGRNGWNHCSVPTVAKHGQEPSRAIESNEDNTHPGKATTNSHDWMI